MPTTTVQQFQNTYGPVVQSIGNSASVAYFSHLPFFQFISILLTTVFVAGSIYIIIQTGWLRSRMDRFQDVVLKSDASKKKIKESWDDIEGRFFAGGENDLKIAIIEADTLLDDALREAAIPGDNLGARLKKLTTAKLPNIEDVWQAHKLRNRIAHEGDFVLRRDLAERALTVYETALEHLGVLAPESKLPNGEEPVKEERPKAKSHSGKSH